jgi:hypothetical protein
MKIRRVGDIIHKWEIRNAFKIVVEKIYGRREIARPTRRRN